MNKDKPKNAARQAKSTTNYFQLKTLLHKLFLAQPKVNFPHAWYAKQLGCSSRTIRRCFVLLREDPTYHISKPKRQPKNLRYYFPLFVVLKVSLALLFSPLVLEVESKEYIRVKTQSEASQTTQKGIIECRECNRSFTYNPKLGNKCFHRMTLIEKNDWNRQMKRNQEEKDVFYSSQIKKRRAELAKEKLEPLIQEELSYEQKIKELQIFAESVPLGLMRSFLIEKKAITLKLPKDIMDKFPPHY